LVFVRKKLWQDTETKTQEAYPMWHASCVLVILSKFN
jgi:hypothetical protein